VEAVINGFGRHIETISAGELVEQGKVAIGGIIFYVLTHMALKLSILLQYVRISVMPFEKRFCYVIIVILIAQSLAMIGTHLALCRPFHALWTPNVPGAVCLNRTMVYYAQLSMTIVMDFGVLVAPPVHPSAFVTSLDPETDDPCRSVFRRNVRYSHLTCALTHIHRHPEAAIQPMRIPDEPEVGLHRQQPHSSQRRNGAVVAGVSTPCHVHDVTSKPKPKPRG